MRLTFLAPHDPLSFEATSRNGLSTRFLRYAQIEIREMLRVFLRLEFRMP
jgi:hypothetical protein